MGGVQLKYAVLTLHLATDKKNNPRLPAPIDPETLELGPIRPELARTGAKTGDRIEAVDGQPIQSLMDTGRIFYKHKAGEQVTLTLARGKEKPFHVSFAAARRDETGLGELVLPVILNIITPWFCIVLGFWVAFRRTGDPVAYALLGLLLCVSQVLKAEAAPRYGWEALFSWPGVFLDFFPGRVLPAAWLWFAIVFPDPASRDRLWPWSRWVIALPFILFNLVVAVYATVISHHAHAMRWLAWLDATPNWLIMTWISVMVGLGFANFGRKLGREKRPAMRRRLRWVLLGLTLGFFPVLTMLGVAVVTRMDLNSIPPYILFPVVLTPFFVPMTLAYAVLVDRVFDVGVFIRQGLLASKTVAFLRVAAVAGLIWLGFWLGTREGVETWIKILGVVACATAILLIRRAADQLRAWVDRRFFQEAVNTEHLLIELSSEVRRIRSAEALLRTVTERLASALHVSRVVVLIPNHSHFVPAHACGVSEGTWDIALSDPVVAEMREHRQPLQRADDLLLPLTAGDELQGILSLGPKRSEEPYSGRDLRLLESVAIQTGLALENSRLTVAVAEQAAQRERLSGELEIARQVQERLFPKRAPVVCGLELAGLCLPAQTVGGDYYDFLSVPPGLTGLAIGDIAGKGVAAALLMAGLQASLRGLTLAGVSDLADLMAKLNTLVYDATPANRFATFFYGLYDPETRVLRYSSAGHNPVLLHRKEQDQMIWLKTPGVALGLRRTSSYIADEVTLHPGDELFLYTDGVTEARNPEGEEFGEDRLVRAVKDLTSISASDRLSTLIADVQAFGAGAAQHDDITVIVARAVPFATFQTGRGYTQGIP